MHQIKQKILLFFFLSPSLLASPHSSFSLNIGPHLLPLGSGFGGQLEISINKNISLKTNYMYTAIIHKGENSDFDLSSNQAQIKGSYYFSESFYFNLGLGYVRTSLGHKNFPRPNQAKLNSLGTVIGFGNAWKWKSLHLGIEWSNLYTPFINFADSLPKESSWIMLTPKEQLEEDITLIKESAYLGVLHLFIGFVF